MKMKPAKLFVIVHCLVWQLLPILVLFSFPSLVLTQIGISIYVNYLISFLLAVSIYIIMTRHLKIELDIKPKLEKISPYQIVILGIFIRLLWLYLFPVAQTSDSASYVALANKLISGEDYRISNTFAHWPPGYPFF